MGINDTTTLTPSLHLVPFCRHLHNLHTVKTDHICHAQYNTTLQHPTTSLSMHNKMHYIPTTTDPTAFHSRSLHTTNKHIPCWNCSAWAVLGLYGMWSSLLLNMADVGHLLCVRLEWTAEYLVHSMRTNRLSVCREFCGVHGWQNGTRYRDGVKVLLCHWFPSSLGWFLRLPSLHVLVFLQQTFCDLFLLLFSSFLYCRLGMVREKKGGRGGQGEDAWTTFCSLKTNHHHKLKCFQVKL